MDASSISSYSATNVGTYVVGDVVIGSGIQADIKGASFTSPNWNYTSASTNGTSTVSVSTDQLSSDITGLNKLTVLNLSAFIEGYMFGSSMVPVLMNSGMANPPTDCDNITVELHNTNSPYNLAYTFTGVLQTNGTLGCTFPQAAIGNYYIVLKHRNALQTWSALPVTFTPNTIYNFSTSATQAFGSNMKQVGSLWTLFSGF
ncbi:MAG: hypothetical protein IPJ13_02020 [Saprospiraceae bacterium]|nr:hypothetical protein [Saprospiraceae bacterium]